ncbi:unnamed protein product [Discosporangium mesarthrocarpum]
MSTAMLRSSAGKSLRMRSFRNVNHLSGLREAITPGQWLSRPMSNAAPSLARNAWKPGHPPPSREKTLGEEFAALQYHGRGGRRVKLSALHHLINKVEVAEDLKYAKLGLEMFRRKKCPVDKATATLFVKACCRVGQPKTAAEALTSVDWGIGEQVSANTFNYLLTQLHKAGENEVLKEVMSGTDSRVQALDNRSREIMKKSHAAWAAAEAEAAAAATAAAAEAEAAAVAAKAEASATAAETEAEPAGTVETDSVGNEQDEGAGAAEKSAEGFVSPVKGEGGSGDGNAEKEGR